MESRVTNIREVAITVKVTWLEHNGDYCHDWFHYTEL